MRKLVIGSLVTAGAVAVVVVVAFAVHATTSEYTECYGIFKSRAAAERAADAARDAGLGIEVDHRRSESAVTFDTGETGADATGARETFREILKREGGAPGHPGNGCIERTPFN